MITKYIIKNCPAYCYLGKECHNEEGQYGASCCEITDCIIKQIVERCKKVRESTADICTNPYEYATYCETRGVLQLLDIQELE